MVKHLPANAGDLRDVGRGTAPRGGNGNHSKYSCLGNPILCPRGPRQSSRLSTQTHTSNPRHRNSPVTGMYQTCAWPVACSSLTFPGQEQLLKLLPSCSYCYSSQGLPPSKLIGFTELSTYGGYKKMYLDEETE